MCVDSGIWNKQKEEISDTIGELTSIWNVGINQRRVAIDHYDVKSIYDPRLNARVLGVNGKRANVIDSIIKINKQKNNVKMLPRKITSDMYDWRDGSNDLFIDFEVMSDIFFEFGDLPVQKKTNMIFMIGAGWFEDGEWNHKSFIVDDLTLDEEVRIMEEFHSFIEERNQPKLIHWCADEGFGKMH